MLNPIVSDGDSTPRDIACHLCRQPRRVRRADRARCPSYVRVDGRLGGPAFCAIRQPGVWWWFYRRYDVPNRDFLAENNRHSHSTSHFSSDSCGTPPPTYRQYGGWTRPQGNVLTTVFPWASRRGPCNRGARTPTLRQIPLGSALLATADPDRRRWFPCPIAPTPSLSQGFADCRPTSGGGCARSPSDGGAVCRHVCPWVYVYIF